MHSIGGSRRVASASAVPLLLTWPANPGSSPVAGSAGRGGRLGDAAHVDVADDGGLLADRGLRGDRPLDVAVRHRVATAANAELAGDGGQREHGRDRAAAVAVALDAPATADHRGR